MKLEEAQASYIPPVKAAGKMVNRRIKTYLKKSLREKIEVVTGESWQSLEREYSAEFLIEGSPESGKATLRMHPIRSCYGIGNEPRKKIELTFDQKELFEV